MNSLQQNFSVNFNYEVFFTKNIFNRSNPLLLNVFKAAGEGRKKVFFVLDDGVCNANPDLTDAISDYTQFHREDIKLIAEPMVIAGGEECKNNRIYLERLLEAINNHNICRHSFIVAIGGGAVLDLVGFAAAIGHRGIRHVRVPTTVLSQNDSGVGVKNGINSFDKKNFLGTFSPPFAVINDSNFLQTLEDRDWLAGISEAIKVALIKDRGFFYKIKDDVTNLLHRDMDAMDQLIYRCAKMHLEHIGSRDPFETGSSRPLDFGHWAAHKLEQLTNYKIRHGEAVAVGIALDATYSMLEGMLPEHEWEEIIELFLDLNLDVYLPELEQMLDKPSHPGSLLHGLEEFREHLGGQLTIMLLNGIGKGVEVNEIDHDIMVAAIVFLENCNKMKVTV
jgi:3-dehydroquinate synthase